MKNFCINFFARLSIALLLMGLVIGEAHAQSLTVSGVVKDHTGEPLIGVNVVEKGTTNGIITDVDGKYTLSVSGKQSVISFSYIGYLTQDITVGNQKNIDVTLKEDTEELEEVVVIGYGTAKKSDLTGTVASVTSKNLDKIQSNSLVEKMAGSVPGLNIKMEDARPGADMKMNVRGENSLTADNDPLIILDGIPYSGSLNNIDPGSIESMSVLKDASSAAIYGSKASNGVILITTKRGRAGQIQVSYRGQVALETVERSANMMKGDEYVKYVQDYKSLQLGLSGDDLDPYKILTTSERDNWKNGKELDWEDLLYRTSLTHNHQVSLSGGTEKSSYYGALSFADQPGVLEGSNYSRINATLNLDQSIKDWLKVGLSMQFAERNTGGATPDTGGTGQSPYGTLYNENGTYYDYPSDNTFLPNPFADINMIDDEKRRSIFVNTYALVQLPIKGLSYRANFGYNYRVDEDGEYYGRNTMTGRAVGGYAMVENKNYYDWTFENIVNYEREFGKHTLKTTGLFSMQETMERTNKAEGEMFVNDDSYYHNMELAEKNVKASTGRVGTSMVSYMGRINYGYDNRYLLTVTARGDAYSAFGKNNKWALFPSVAGAWVVSQEEFMAGTRDFMDQLKIRLSYGANGNQAIKPYRTLDRMELYKYIWDKEAANGAHLALNGIGNPNLKWETTNTFNFGLDFSFLNSRISGTLDVYKNKTKDLLMQRQVPVMNGFTSILDNIGSTENKGFELTLRTRNINTEDFSWSSMVNIALNRDKIIELRGDGKDDLANKWFIGKPLRVVYDYEWIGVWQSDDDPAEMEKYGAQPGDAKLKDQNNDGKINAKDDKVILGSKAPKATMGFSNDFTYKDFYLSIFCDGVFGVMQDLPEKNFVTVKNYRSNPGYWMPDNPTNDCPSPVYEPYDRHGYYYSVNYFRIKNVTLGYNLPKAPLTKMGISDLGVYLGVNNLYTFTNHIGQSVDGGGYPTARTFTLGLNLTF